MKALAAVLGLAISSGGASAERTGLLIIDMQPRFVELRGHHLTPDNSKKVRRVHARLRRLIGWAKLNEMPIVVIETPTAGPTSPELTQLLANYPRALTLHKSRDDVFSKVDAEALETRNALIEFLNRNFVRGLVVTGLHGSQCVRWSCEGALWDGFRVWADGEGIIDCRGPRFVHPYRLDRAQMLLRTGLPRNYFRQGDASSRFRPGSDRWTGFAWTLREFFASILPKSKPCADQLSDPPGE